MPLVEAVNLSKSYKEKKALDSISFSVKQGEIFGVLGPNGAGKTTLISILTTLFKPTSGLATINSYNVAKDGETVRRLIGVVFQDFLLDEELTAWDNLDIHGRLYGLCKKELEKRIKTMLSVVGLSAVAAKNVKTFSGGMKRRLELARGLIGEPKILFLDEPTIGLDPIAKLEVWKYIKKINTEKWTTIILTTNNMDEAETLCDSIIIIHEGKEIKKGNVQKIKSNHGEQSLESIFIESVKSYG